MAKHGKKLTAAFMRSVQQPGIYCDEHRLILSVKPSGYKQWIQRLVIDGKRRELGLGPLRLVTLTEAREAAFANRKLARSGGDPQTSRRRGVPTFEQAAAKGFEIHRPTWRSGRRVTQWTASLHDFAHPRIGPKPVDRITSADIMALLLPIWNRRPATRAVRHPSYKA